MSDKRRIVARGPNGERLDTIEDAERKRREYAEETGDEMPVKAEKKAPAEGMLAKLSRIATQASASVSGAKPWAKFTDDDEDDK